MLLGMMARFLGGRIVVGLIGERGREVKDFIENILGAGERTSACGGCRGTGGRFPAAADARVPPMPHRIAEYYRIWSVCC